MAIRRRDNFGQSMKQSTIHITKYLQDVAEETATNVRLVVADELQKKYKENVEASYTPSTVKGQNVLDYNKNTGAGGHKKKLTYRHTKPSIFLNSLYAKIDGTVIKMMIRDDETYPNGRKPSEVYEYLTKGTRGGDKPYPYVRLVGNDKSNPDSYVTGWSNKSYPMPAHLFDQHTILQMKGFLDGLDGRIKNGEFSSFRYTGKKKKRTSYRGENLV